MTSYRPLAESDAIAYAKALPGLFPPSAELSCREIGDGNLNLVFHITESRSGKSIIMKQALPYAKVVGESWPLSLDRARIEHDALKVQGSLAPGLVPQVFHYDADLAMTVMEDLSDHVIMRRGLIEGNRYPQFAEHISHFLAHTLYYTSDYGMNQQDKKVRTGQFINPDLCKITEDLIFEQPYFVSEMNDIDPLIEADAEVLRTDRELHLEVAYLREKFLTHSQALLHGDLHTGSIFVTAESTKVIDPEFAFYGPMGFDIGAVLGNLLLNFAGQEGWISNAAELADYRHYLLDTVHDVWSGFDEKFRALWHEHTTDKLANSIGFLDKYMERLLHDSIGFAGAKMVRRIVGLAHVADVHTIADPETRARAQRLALLIGTELIKQARRLRTIGDATRIAKLSVGLA